MSKYDTSREDAEFGRDCQMDEDDRRAERDMRRQKAIESAVQAADEIILEASDGSCEETNFLTGMVAEKFVQKACHPFRSAMLKTDLGV